MKKHTMAKQNHLLDTKTVRLNKLGLNVRYTELGNSTTRRCCYCMAFPRICSAGTLWHRSWPRSTTCWRSIGWLWAGATH